MLNRRTRGKKRGQIGNLTLYSRYDKHSDSGSTLQDEISDGFGRVTQFSNTSGDPGDVYIQYSHIGPSRLAGRLSKSASGYKGNDTFLDLDSDGTGDNYAGLDLFGRIVSPKVTDESASTNLSDIQYQSNRDGSPQFAQPQANVVIGRSSLYSYDNLNRLSQADSRDFRLWAGCCGFEAVDARGLSSGVRIEPADLRAGFGAARGTLACDRWAVRTEVRGSL